VLQAARLMTATLSCDHRIVDGVTAAAFLNKFKQLLEHPSELPA
jgi:pyruvate dehydrogenase E2 component (dihydrolipoamide acetyltransferase)